MSSSNINVQNIITDELTRGQRKYSDEIMLYNTQKQNKIMTKTKLARIKISRFAWDEINRIINSEIF